MDAFTDILAEVLLTGLTLTILQNPPRGTF